MLPVIVNSLPTLALGLRRQEPRIIQHRYGRDASFIKLGLKKKRYELFPFSRQLKGISAIVAVSVKT